MMLPMEGQRLRVVGEVQPHPGLLHGRDDSFKLKNV